MRRKASFRSTGSSISVRQLSSIRLDLKLLINFFHIAALRHSASQLQTCVFTDHCARAKCSKQWKWRNGMRRKREQFTTLQLFLLFVFTARSRRFESKHKLKDAKTWTREWNKLYIKRKSRRSKGFDFHVEFSTEIRSANNVNFYFRLFRANKSENNFRRLFWRGFRIAAIWEDIFSIRK